MGQAGEGQKVTVLGAGIFGLVTGWSCLLRGAEVEIRDPNHVGAGATGGLVGALAPHVPENWNPKKAFQLDSLLQAESFWAGVARAGGEDPGYLRSGRLQPLADAAAVELAERRAVTAAELWRGRAEWQVLSTAEAVERWGADWVGEGGSGAAGFVHDTLTARLSPRLAARALVAAIRARGGVVLEGEAARAAAAPEGLVIEATGAAGLAALSEKFGRNLGTGIKGQAALFRPERSAAALPQLFLGGLHVVPHVDGTVAVGSTTERDYAAPNTTDEQLEALIEQARAAVPLLAGAELAERWAGLRPRARSRAPMLGAVPERPGHFVANGGFKIGFGMAPKVGEVMADLVLGGQDGIPAGFRLEDNL